MTEWIRFEKLGTSPSGKTEVWNVISNSNDSVLGKIKWYSGWRQYAFFPEDVTLYNYDCLKKISEFVLNLTGRHKNK